MKKLYVSPGACSMSCHIAFEEAKIPFEAKIKMYDEVAKLNPMGAVPVLVLEDGKVLTQNMAILTFAASQAPSLLPKPGSYEFMQAYQWLAWTSSDLHPTFGPLWDSELPEAQRKETMEEVKELLEIADAHLGKNKYLAGDQFTIADALFFTVSSWAGHHKISTGSFRNLASYQARIAERPAVQAVMKREGLIK